MNVEKIVITEIILANKNHVKKIARTLSDAFLEDPIFSYSIPNSKRRIKHLHVLFEVLARYAVEFGEVYITSEDNEGTMITLPSEKINVSAWQYIKCGGFKIPFHLGFGFIRKVLKLDEIMGPKHKELPPYPHLYLHILGVHSSHRGKGHGGALLRHLIKIADEKGLPCYLETATEINLSLYKHFGFEILEEIDFSDKGFNVWLMLRKKQ